MQLTVRMPDEYGEKIEALSRQFGVKKSDIVRMALRQFADERLAGEESTPFQRVRHLVGVAKSGIPDLGRRHREHVIRRLRARG